MAANSDAEKSRLRWLDAARYAVAAVVTVLIVAVIANAIKVVLRPEPMSVSVLGGSVSSQRIIPDRMSFVIKVRTQNPSGRAVMYYVNIKAHLLDKNTPESSSNLHDSIIFFSMKDTAVLQGGLVDSLVHAIVTRRQMTSSYFDKMYSNNGSTISGVTLRLDGTLITEVPAGGANSSARPTTYYCRQLLVGGEPGDKAFEDKPDVLCSDVQGSRHVLLWLSMLACMVALIQTL